MIWIEEFFGLLGGLKAERLQAAERRLAVVHKYTWGAVWIIVEGCSGGGVEKLGDEFACFGGVVVVGFKFKGFYDWVVEWRDFVDQIGW